MENFLEALLKQVGGLAFGASFLGKYLGFRDAWAIACTGHAGYEAFHSKSYVQTYIRHRILKPFPIFVEPVEGFELLNKLPLGSIEYRDYAHVHEVLHQKSDPVFHRFASQIRDHEVAPLELESAVRHLNCAAKIVYHGLERKSEFQIPIITKTGAHKKRRKHRKLDWSYKPSHYDWPAHLSTILVDWANGHAGSIGDWEPQSWSHQVLRFLTHAVDLESSIWQPYLADIRYQGYFRHHCFDVYRKNSPLDFWLLVNDLYSNPGGTITRKQPLVSLYASQTPSLRCQVFSGDRESFGYMYNFHATVARTLVENQENPQRRRSFLNGVIIQSTTEREGRLYARSLSQAGTAILVEKSPLVPPDLVAVVADDLWYPMKDAWEIWGPAIKNQ